MSKILVHNKGTSNLSMITLKIKQRSCHRVFRIPRDWFWGKCWKRLLVWRYFLFGLLLYDFKDDRWVVIKVGVLIDEKPCIHRLYWHESKRLNLLLRAIIPLRSTLCASSQEKRIPFRSAFLQMKRRELEKGNNLPCQHRRKHWSNRNGAYDCLSQVWMRLCCIHADFLRLREFVDFSV